MYPSRQGPAQAAVGGEQQQQIQDVLEAKVVVLGDTGVGKTCLVFRFVEGRFQSHGASTIGASFMVKKLTLDGTKLTLQIWDTAGQERFRSMAPMYYRGAAAAILVMDCTSKDSFAKVRSWVAELKKNVAEDVVLTIACNKCDMAAQRQVSQAEGEEYARSIGAHYFETSAKTNRGIEELFLSLSKSLIQRRRRTAAAGQDGTAAGAGAAAARGNTVRVGDGAAPPASKSACC